MGESRARVKIRSAVSRDEAETYLLTSLVAFAVTVIVTRTFLEVTGFPQIGSDVLHIAHALWGGLLLFVAALLPLALANRWAIQASALLGGIGTGLFFDEVGKFITQANDYFFPPALPLIYAIFLLNVLVYSYFRRSPKRDPRFAMYHAFEQLQDVLDGDLDEVEADHVRALLSIAVESDRPEIASLARALKSYVETERRHLAEAQPSLRQRVVRRIGRIGQAIGRWRHRLLILGVLAGWMLRVAIDILAIVRRSNVEPHVAQWRLPLIILQIGTGMLMAAAIALWVAGREHLGLRVGLGGLVISLAALQLLYFYISQFSAITDALLQLVGVLILVTYRRWYLREPG